jgi:choline dehydrogenase
MQDEYDHIVIGGGASGCVAAARLVTDGDRRVLLLEAGHSHHHPLLDMPPGIFKLINGSKYMTYHHTVPQAHLKGRVHDIPQGNVLGGGSSVNAQVYMRGRPSDYDEWDEILRGNNDGASWGWPAVLRHFRRIEGNNRLSNDLHGNDGPLLVSDRRAQFEEMHETVDVAELVGEDGVDLVAASTTSRAGSSRACRRWASRSPTISMARPSAASASTSS